VKLVVDSNQLQDTPQSDRLRRFLSASPSNIAILTDYAAMEAYKGDTLASIYKSMAVLAEYPRQVQVLKSTLVVCGLRGRHAGLQRRLIHEAQTAGFPTYATNLRRAQAGNKRLEAELLDFGHEATAHLSRMRTDAEKTGRAFTNAALSYSKAERRAVRQGDVYSTEFVRKAIFHIIQVATLAFTEHPRVLTRPPTEELPNTYIFRAALCMHLLMLDWAARGGAEAASPERLRNDIVDVNFAAYATYFDGLLSGDAKANRLHSEARLWLTAVFGAELPSGWQGAQFE